MRLVAFTDYVYREADGIVYGDRAFATFMAALGDHFELTIAGRLDPESGACRYPLPAGVAFLPLPHYRSLARPLAVMRSLLSSVARFWYSLERADRVWLLGPYPHAVAFGLLALLRRRRLILGVRQDFPAYVRSRRSQRWMHASADLLELAWRSLALVSPTVVVGAELARKYRHAPSVLEIAVSLISEQDVQAGVRAFGQRSYNGRLCILSVGRLDREKNPLLLADILEGLRAHDDRWRLTVCGDGPLRGELQERLSLRGLDSAADLLGYVPMGDALLAHYRDSHVFLHVSLTEGMPQVLLEAFASGTPVVATAVGGVPEAATGAALLIPPADAAAAVAALVKLSVDRGLRERLVHEGSARARASTMEREVARVAEFIASPGSPRDAAVVRKPPG